MKRIKSQLLHIGMGTALGVILCLAALALKMGICGKNTSQGGPSIQNAKTKIDTVKFGNYTLEIKERSEVEVRERNEVLEEKIKSFNDRIADLYVSVGVIVTLLLAIFVGLYVKTEVEVEKHMYEIFEKYRNEIERMSGDASSLLTEIQSKSELINEATNKVIKIAKSGDETTNVG